MRCRALVLIGSLAMMSCTREISSVDVGSSTTTATTITNGVPPISVTTPLTSPGQSTIASPVSTATPTTTTTTTTTTTVPPIPTTTSCEQVVHIGDSTSTELFSADQVGRAENTLDARYLAVGVDAVYPDNDRDRAIVEVQDGGQANAYDVAVAVKENGYEGCWVLMIGTNDVAAVAAGSAVGYEARINKMLTLIGDDPVLWVDSVTLLASDLYSDAGMQAWNGVLYRLATDHPNLAVLRWSEVVKAGWFARDGIHYNTTGHTQRAAITAAALVQYFPG
jgi:hypothetical protein